MTNNVTGGIILLLVGAGIIALGTSARGKEIFNIIATGESTQGAHGEKIEYSGAPNDPDYIPPPGTSNLFGFNGERGANYVG